MSSHHARRTRGHFRTYTSGSGLKNRELTTLVEDASGNLWLGTAALGIIRLARNGFVTYGEPDGLLTVNAIFEDAAGGLCIRAVALRDRRPYAFDGAHRELPRASVETFSRASDVSTASVSSGSSQAFRSMSIPNPKPSARRCATG
ncbi:MAG: hypothetical protein HYR56_25745 [Acidobacteria bacterium]|nr:hypothetical protein [Acidobacteriota bacterium]